MMTRRCSPLLRWALVADSIASGAMALLMLLFAGALEGLLQIPAQLLFNVGLILVPYAALVGYLGTRAALPSWIVWTVIGANLLWVLDSVLIAVSGWIAPNALGYTFTFGQALAVAVLAELQFVGLRRSGAALA